MQGLVLCVPVSYGRVFVSIDVKRGQSMTAIVILGVVPAVELAYTE